MFADRKQQYTVLWFFFFGAIPLGWCCFGWFFTFHYLPTKDPDGYKNIVIHQNSSLSILTEKENNENVSVVRRKRFVRSHDRYSGKSICRDSRAYLRLCTEYKALGHCHQPSVRNVCERTCRVCGYGTWGDWSSWNKCSVSCGFGIRSRRRKCLGYKSCYGGKREEIIGCGAEDCDAASRELMSKGRIGFSFISSRANLYIPKKQDTKETKCDAHAFKCPKTDKCYDVTRKCNEKADCGSGFDEEECILGLRYDNVFGIINWHYHNCLEPNMTTKDPIRPQGYRRCPGPYNKNLLLFKWSWDHYNNLNALKIRQCLAVDVELSDNKSIPHNISVAFKPCDYYEPKQHWICEIYYVRLLRPHRALPRENVTLQYLRLSDDGPGNYLEMTDKKDKAAKFRMLGTNSMLNICAKKGIPGRLIVNPWTPCTKTCGNGTMSRLQKCAVTPGKTCGSGPLYEYKPCNTDPCPIICPPGFSAHYSPLDKKDINCFKAFKTPMSYADGQKFCASNNWTLAADKDIHAHKFLLNLMKDTPKLHLGAYEHLSSPMSSPFTHPVKFQWDGQPLGGFQPWKDYSAGNTEKGCVIGYGLEYHGSISSAMSGGSCQSWNDTKLYKRLHQLVSPYKPMTHGYSATCQNPSAQETINYCFVESGNAVVKTPCKIKNCLSPKPTSSFPKVKAEHMFIIHSLEGDNMCLSILSSKKVVMAPCDCADDRQNFYWFGGTHLVNSAASVCLAANSLPPVHGEELVAEDCSRDKATLNQGWNAKNQEISVMSIPDLGPSQKLSPLYVLSHNVKENKVVMVDKRRRLFLAWNIATGLISMSKLAQKIPSKAYFSLRGPCKSECIKVDTNTGRVNTAPCAQRDETQRWVRLSENVIMNVVMGLCLSSIRMQSYVILADCNVTDEAIHWEWKFAETDKSLILMNKASKYYLTCGCTGYTAVCLTPVEKKGWEPVIGNEEMFELPIVNYTAMLGYAFVIHAPYNLTKCARPAKASNDPKSQYTVVMTDCKLEDKGQLWWFSGSTSYIKHRALNLCLQAVIPKTPYTVHSKSNPSIILSPCSHELFSTQSWRFLPGPSPRSNLGRPGDYIHLTVNSSLLIAVEIGEGFGKDDDLLVLHVETRALKWQAVLSNGVFLEMGRLKDCVSPWTKMKDYRGTTSWTKSGIECQKWASQWPHKHPFSNVSHPWSGLNSNYCRRPQSLPSDSLDESNNDAAWCLTTDPVTQWQECSVTKCPVTGTVIDRDSTRWEANQGKDLLPVFCHSLPECYLDNGVTYSGYYNHTGRGACINWREYNKGDTNWPDHNRCMNWNNDTLKPWCWVGIGVAQYCELVVPCPIRCRDPTPLLKNMNLVSINYASSSKLYMPQTTVQVACKKGYNLTDPERVDQILECTKSGTWTPGLKTCHKIFCPNPETLNHAKVITRNKVHAYGSATAYQCSQGTMVEPGRTLIDMTCLHNGTWSLLQYECKPACEEGWTPFNRSCYRVFHERKNFVSYDLAKERCKRTGKLAVPKTDVEYDFLRHLVTSTIGFSEKYLWVGLYDTTKEDLMDDATVYNWVGDEINGVILESNLYLEKLREKSFMIRNFASNYHTQVHITYQDICMYGDNITNTVHGRSCMFGNGTGMRWKWITNRQLFNLDAELCLVGKYYDGNSPGNLSLAPCNFQDEHQSFTCGPHSGYLLKLRHHSSSYLSYNLDSPSGDIIITGEDDTDMAMWHIMPGFQYLCHWNVKPPDQVFLVHKDLTPSFFSYSALDPDLCKINKTGAKMVDKSKLIKYIKEEPMGYCTCGFLLDDNGKRKNMMTDKWNTCNAPGVTGSGGGELKTCKDASYADSWCYRSSPYRPRPRWCASMTVQDQNENGDWLEVTQCETHLPGYICESNSKWPCPHPPQPKNSVPIFEGSNTKDMQFSYASTIEVHCKDGFWIEKEKEYSVNLHCNRYLHWETEAKQLREGDKETFVDNRENREEAARNIKCVRIKCGDPPVINGMHLVSSAEIYWFETIVTYECNNGTWFSPGKRHYNMTCMADGTWQPPLSDDKACKTISCPYPVSMKNANMSHDGVFFKSNLNYTCLEGFWFSRKSSVFSSKCSQEGRWFPDAHESNATCVPISCYTPTPEMLKKSFTSVLDGRTMYGHRATLRLQCLPGYWFDKDSFIVNFTCNIRGQWKPFSPARVKCERVYCKKPDDVPGATRYGTEYISGSHIRYQCAPLNWVRQQFRIHSPHWGLCLRVSGASYLSPDGTESLEVTLDNACNERDTMYHWWAWQWSFHLVNRVTNKCLTAAALPSMKEDLVRVFAEVCDKENLYQWWSCSSSQENHWLLTLRAATRGGYLTTETDEKAYWSGQSNVIPFVTGDHESSSVKSFWKIYGNNDPLMNICLLREGQFYEQSNCNSFGDWNPDPKDIECTIVDCGEPPEVENSILVPLEGADFSSAYSRSYFRSISAKERLSGGRPRAPVATEFPVSSQVQYYCMQGFWVKPDQYTFKISCLDNSMWDPDPYTNSTIACVPVSCPAPIVAPHAKATVQPYSRAFLHQPTEEQILSKLEEGNPLPPYRGIIVFTSNINASYVPIFKSKIKLECDPGFWIHKNALASKFHRYITSGLDGTVFLQAECMDTGVWSLPDITKAVECSPLYCYDPGFILNSKRVTEFRSPVKPSVNGNDSITNQTNVTSTVSTTTIVEESTNQTNVTATTTTTAVSTTTTVDELITFPYNTLMQYQCNMGFWFTETRTYTEIHCNEEGIWQPDPSQMECIPVSCGDPGSVLNAEKIGSSYTVYNEVTYHCMEGCKINNQLNESTIKCMTDGRWFPPPFSILCELVKCGTLPRINNAKFYNESQQFPWKFVSGDTVIMRCDSGYQLDSKTTEVKFSCNFEGEWVPADEGDIGSFHCELALCAPPPVVQNVQLVDHAKTYRMNDTVHYACPPGMELADHSGLAVKVVCSLNTKSTHSNSSGNQANARKPIFATSWNPNPMDIKCIPVECYYPGTLPRASVIVAGNHSGESAEYSCLEGYQVSLNNNSKIKTFCNDYGEWKPDPSSFSCDPITCPLPVINKGVKKAQKERPHLPYYRGDQVTMTCPDGEWFADFRTNGMRGTTMIVTECLEDGRWSVETIFATCENITCLHPGLFNGATIVSTGRLPNQTEPDEYPINEKLNISCKEGYALSLTGTRGMVIVCSEFGEWRPIPMFGNDPGCFPINCPDPGERNNSIRSVEGFGPGDKIIYYADSGYTSLQLKETLVTLQCMADGTWNVEESNDIVKYINNGSSRILSRKRRQIDSMQITSNNSVSHEVLTFVRFECPVPDYLPNDTHVDDELIGKNIELGANITVHCAKGYYIALNQSETVLTCSDTGEWWPHPSLINCLDARLLHCDLPKQVKNASILGTSYSMDGELTIQCHAGFEANETSSSVTIKCMKDGDWSPNSDDIRCKEVMCNEPPDLDQSTKSFSSTDYGSKVDYQCDKGHNFRRLGSQTNMIAICVNSLNWSPNPIEFKCSPVVCEDPPKLPYATVAYNKTDFQSVASYTCNNGYHMKVDDSFQQSADATCNANGEWSFGNTTTDSKKTFAQCEPVTCGKPSPVPNSHEMLYGEFSYKAKAVYRCLNGYDAVTSEPAADNTTFMLVCSAAGNWVQASDMENGADSVADTDRSECVKKQCSQPPDIIHATKTYKNDEIDEYGSIVKYVCNKDYKLAFGQAEVEVTCMANGKWDPDIDNLKCEILKCPEPPEMPNGSGDGEREVGSSWSYKCNPEYEIKHQVTSVTMKCSSYGKWMPSYSMINKCHKVSCAVPHLFPPYATLYDRDGEEILPEDESDKRYHDYTIGSHIIYKCHTGYWDKKTNDQSAKFSCSSEARWDPKLDDMFICSTVTCESPPKVEGLQLSGTFASDRYWYDTSVRYDCPYGTHVRELQLQSVKSRCGPNGTFIPDPSTLNCSKTECDDYMMPHADRTVLTSLKEYGIAQYKCHHGYWFNKWKYMEMYRCTKDGSWQPSISEIKCRRITCGDVKIENIFFVKGTTVEFGSKIDVRCEDGYALNKVTKAFMHTLTCLDGGRYEPPVSSLRCEPIPCEKPPSIPNSMVYGQFYYGGFATLQCHIGFLLGKNEFNARSQCGRDGSWSVDFRKYECTPVICSSPPGMQYAKRFGNGTKYASVIRYVCDEGYWLGSNQFGNPFEVSVTCSAYGTWSTSYVACMRIICLAPEPVSGAEIIENGYFFRSVIYYMCKPKMWIASRNSTHWNLSGKKEIASKCMKNGTWIPDPAKMKCVSIYDGDLKISSEGIPSSKQNIKKLKDTSRAPYRSLSSDLPTKWLVFDESKMTLSDSIHVRHNITKENLTRSHRDVRFIWDADALSFWVGESNSSKVKEREWIVDIYLGQPYALFSVMVMCVDDSYSDVANFSIVYAGLDKRAKYIGPFKVYGEEGISGRNMQSFPLNYSSIATVFTYGGLTEEVLWMHLIIHPLVPGFVPAVREVGFLVSEVKWELKYPADPTPVLIMGLVFIFAAIFIVPLLYLVDSKETGNRIVINIASASPKITSTTYQIVFRSTSKLNADNHILIQLTGNKKTGPLVWIRCNCSSKLLLKNVKIVINLPIPGKDGLGELANVRLLAWGGSRDPLAALLNNKTSGEPQKTLQITDLQVKKIMSGSCSGTWSGSVQSKPFNICFFKPHIVELQKKIEHPLEIMWNNKYFRCVRCHLCISPVHPAPGAFIGRLENFLCLLNVLLLGLICTLVFQLNFGLMELQVAEKSIANSSVTSDNTYSFVLMALMGSSICLPIPFLLKGLYYCAYSRGLPNHSANQDPDIITRFCSHKIFHTDKPRLPFMSNLRIYLALFLGVHLPEFDGILKNVTNTSTSVSANFRFTSMFDDLQASTLQRRWSESALIYFNKVSTELENGVESSILERDTDLSTSQSTMFNLSSSNLGRGESSDVSVSKKLELSSSLKSYFSKTISSDTTTSDHSLATSTTTSYPSPSSRKYDQRSMENFRQSVMNKRQYSKGVWSHGSDGRKSMSSGDFETEQKMPYPSARADSVYSSEYSSSEHISASMSTVSSTQSESVEDTTENKTSSSYESNSDSTARKLSYDSSSQSTKSVEETDDDLTSSSYKSNSVSTVKKHSGDSSSLSSKSVEDTAYNLTSGSYESNSDSTARKLSYDSSSQSSKSVKETDDDLTSSSYKSNSVSTIRKLSEDSFTQTSEFVEDTTENQTSISYESNSDSTARKLSYDSSSQSSKSVKETDDDLTSSSYKSNSVSTIRKLSEDSFTQTSEFVEDTTENQTSISSESNSRSTVRAISDDSKAISSTDESESLTTTSSDVSSDVITVISGKTSAVKTGDGSVRKSDVCEHSLQENHSRHHTVATHLPVQESAPLNAVCSSLISVILFLLALVMSLYLIIDRQAISSSERVIEASLMSMCFNLTITLGIDVLLAVYFFHENAFPQ